MFIGFLGEKHHNIVYTQFQKVGYAYENISTISNIPIEKVAEHVELIVTYMYVAGFQIPNIAYPIPFDIEKHQEFIVAEINRTKELVKNSTAVIQTLSPFFIKNQQLTNNWIYDYINKSTLSINVNGFQKADIFNMLKSLYKVGALQFSKAIDDFLPGKIRSSRVKDKIDSSQFANVVTISQFCPNGPFYISSKE